MTFLILTHNYYAIVSLITLTLGSFFIANHIHERWLFNLNLQLIDANFLTKLFIVAFGSTVISWKSLLNASVEMQLIYSCTGMLLGYSYLTLESYLIFLLCNPLNSPINFNNKIKPTNNILKIKKKNASSIYQSTYFSIFFVGLLEEILYRGFLTALCIALLPAGLNILGLVVVTIVFAINHLNLGNIHVLTKFILGIICLLSFLITKTLITPIFIHATFNTLVIHKYRKLEYA